MSLAQAFLKWWVAGCLLAASLPAASPFYVGVNLSGAEFGQTSLPGIYNQHYLYPNQAEVDYFQAQGLNAIRLPFRWERLQRTAYSPFHAAELARLDGFVTAATGKGMHVILDPHNFARYYPDPANYQSSPQGLVGSAVPNSAFADFWSRLATQYRTNARVIFNLMNEPNSMPTEQWVSAANDAIAAIRAAGATNLILVPGNAYTGAWTWSQNWYGTPNSQALLNIVDPADHYAYDVHQYLDADGSGTSAQIVSATIGAERLAGFTRWLRTNHRQGFLGEFAVANSTIGAGLGDEAIANLLGHIEANRDVWIGWAWWSAGPWWGNYMFTLEPSSNGGDQPAMTILRNFIPIPVPELTLSGPDQFQFFARPGWGYQVEQSATLLDGSWSPFGPSLVGTGQTHSVTFSPSLEASGFYRVRVSPTFGTRRKSG